MNLGWTMSVIEYIAIITGIITILGTIIAVIWKIFQIQNKARLDNYESKIEKLEQQITDLTGNFDTERLVEYSGWGANKVEVELLEKKVMVGTGWIAPVPDPNDFKESDEEISYYKERLNISETAVTSLPLKVDLRNLFSDIRYQGSLNSSTAQAAVAVLEYFNRRAFGIQINPSTRFVYKTTRNLMEQRGDTGASLRDTLGAIRLFGIPPEDKWPHTDKKPDFDEEPPGFLYAFAKEYQALRYFRHDSEDIDSSIVLENVKKYLAAGIPSIFGFYIHSSFSKSNIKGGIPLPCKNEQPKWGQAVVAVGYDDNIKIKNLQCNKETKGALLFRNSWGTNWGVDGYGWLPYDYILNNLALEFWSIISLQLVDTGQFGFHSN